MNAHDTQIFKYLEGSKCFLVPLFQRTYSWEKDDWKTFWSDLKNTIEDKESNHFFGSFVTLPIPSPATEISRYVIIDGQQRLVTTSILLGALRDRIGEIDPRSDLKNAIFEQYLINKFAEKSEDKNKILPTQADRAIFSQIVNNNSNTTSSSSHIIAQAYDFFHKKLLETNNLEDLKELKNTLLNRFLVVDICLDKDDDPYLIFESLNAKGEPLTQADLIRNYLFMKISQDCQQEVFDNIWFPMQQKLNKHMHDLLRWGDLNNGVVCVTNQVSSKPDAFFGDPTRPIGGHIVGHTATFRIYLRKGKKGTRVAKLVDAPNIADGEAQFIVKTEAITDV